ncbi:hypothetical protein FJY90_02050 [Candidatus Gottesmanbacteria bacterium]|nr:hypothetical protein [Candidatus Gottesmanbacteria bacterium]
MRETISYLDWNTLQDLFREGIISSEDFGLPSASAELAARERMELPPNAPSEYYLRKKRQATYEVMLATTDGIHDHLDRNIENTHERWEKPEHSDHNRTHTRIVMKLLDEFFLYNSQLYGTGEEFDMGRAAAYLAADTHDLFQLERKQKEGHPILGALICAVGARHYIQKAREKLAHLEMQEDVFRALSATLEQAATIPALAAQAGNSSIHLSQAAARNQPLSDEQKKEIHRILLYLEEAQDKTGSSYISSQIKVYFDTLNTVMTYDEKTILTAANMVAYHNSIEEVLKDTFSPLSFTDIFNQAASEARSLLKIDKFRSRIHEHGQDLPDQAVVDTLVDIRALCLVCPTLGNYLEDLVSWKETAFEPYYKKNEIDQLSLFAVALRASDEVATNSPPSYSLLRTMATFSPQDRPIFPIIENWNLDYGSWPLTGMSALEPRVHAEGIVDSVEEKLYTNEGDLLRILGEVLENPEHFHKLGKKYQRFHFLNQWQRLKAAEDFFMKLASATNEDQVRALVNDIYDQLKKDLAQRSNITHSAAEQAEAILDIEAKWIADHIIEKLAIVPLRPYKHLIRVLFDHVLVKMIQYGRSIGFKNVRAIRRESDAHTQLLRQRLWSTAKY